MGASVGGAWPGIVNWMNRRMSRGEVGLTDIDRDVGVGAPECFCHGNQRCGSDTWPGIMNSIGQSWQGRMGRTIDDGRASIQLFHLSLLFSRSAVELPSPT